MTIPQDLIKARPINDFEGLARAIDEIAACDELVLLTTMPRGGLQVCRSLRTNETIVRRYAAETHADDRVAWQALQRGVTTVADNVDGRSSHPLAFGYEVTVAVRVESPVFDGYPGVLIVLHRSDRHVENFEPADVATQVRDLYDSLVRHGPRHVQPSTPCQFIFAGGKSLMTTAELLALDPKLALSIEHQLRTFGAESGQNISRFSMPDSKGNCQPVQFAYFEHYRALASGPVVFVSLHPRFEDWEQLKPDSLSADPEASRLAAAVPFMVKHYRRGPTLEEVAASVHLSQFHFHRRFSEVFGLTPKELLYDLQLNEAKRLLADPRQALSEIARHCGFSHQSHFTSRFKQGTGLTPTRWRRQATAAGRA